MTQYVVDRGHTTGLSVRVRKLRKEGRKEARRDAEAAVVLNGLEGASFP
jgi:hypothetical protein